MSTDRMDGELYFHCDQAPCRRNISFDNETEFGDAWRMAKKEGWTTFKIGQDWVHSCPTCAVEKLGGTRK